MAARQTKVTVQNESLGALEINNEPMIMRIIFIVAFKLASHFCHFFSCSPLPSPLIALPPTPTPTSTLLDSQLGRSNLHSMQPHGAAAH